MLKNLASVGGESDSKDDMRNTMLQEIKLLQQRADKVEAIPESTPPKLDENDIWSYHANKIFDIKIGWYNITATLIYLLMLKLHLK